MDEIVKIRDGDKGADLQIVMHEGERAGTILHEAKRTETYRKDFENKLKKT